MTKEKKEETKTKTIHEAFVDAQKGFGKALKTSSNPHFRSKYADLGACVEAVIDALHEQGFALIQLTKPSDLGWVTVQTELLYHTGERLYLGELSLPVTKQDAQGYGSCLTYCRRYNLITGLGIAPEDDDGNQASAGKQVVAPKPRKAVKTYYDVSKLSEDQLAPSVKYLESNGAKEVKEGLFLSPIRLEKLQSLIVEVSEDGI
jgi:hypothetical protein